MQTSKSLKMYRVRFIFRIFVVLAVVFLYFSYESAFEIIERGKFTEKFSFMHIVWAVWIVEIAVRLIPYEGLLLNGCGKQFKAYYNPSSEKVSKDSFQKRMLSSTARGLPVMLIAVVVTTFTGVLRYSGIIGNKEIVVICSLEYLCDIMCIIFWCPFRDIIMKNRCCTTCRIFNWDCIMMFMPLIFVKGFFSYSILAISMTAFLLWEYCFYRHPERFFEDTNLNLRCINCKDKICPEIGRKRK